MPFCIIIRRRRHHAKNQHKGSWSPKCPSVVPFEILHSEGPFEVANFEHFGLERHFNMAAMIVFTPKCPSESDISRLERTVILRQNNVFYTGLHATVGVRVGVTSLPAPLAIKGSARNRQDVRLTGQSPIMRKIVRFRSLAGQSVHL